MERVHLGVAALEAAEVLERADPEWEEWAAPGQGQDQQENAFVLNAERLLLMKSECPATIGSAPNVEKRW
jgi:hypothetical protein